MNKSDRNNLKNYGTMLLFKYISGKNYLMENNLSLEIVKSRYLTGDDTVC